MALIIHELLVVLTVNRMESVPASVVTLIGIEGSDELRIGIFLLEYTVMVVIRSTGGWESRDRNVAVTGARF